MEQDNITENQNVWEDGEQPSLNPYESIIPTDVNKKKVLAADAMVSGIFDGVEPEQSYESVMTSDLNLYQDEMVTKAAAEETQAMSTAIDTLAVTDPILLNDRSADLVAMYQDIQETYNTSNKLAPYIAMVRKFPGSDQASDEEVKDVAAQKYMLSRIAELFDEDYDFGDKSFDVMGLLAWPDLSYNVSQTYAAVAEETGTIESYLDTGDIVVKFTRALQDMEPEKRIEMFDTLRSKVVGVEDNKMKQAILLMYAASQTSEDDVAFDAAMDKVDQTGLGIFLGSGVLKTIKSVNAIRSMVKIANSEREAAVLADIASRSDEAANAVGVPRLDAASAGDPNASVLTDILDGAPEGVSTQVSQQWKMIDENIQEATNIVDEGLGLTAAEKTKAAEARVKILEAKEGIDNVAATPTERGVDLTFDTIDAETGAVKSTQVSLPYTVDDVTGTFVQQGVTFMGELGKSILNSPNYLQGADRNILVQAFERTLFSSSKIKRELNDAFNKTTKSLSKAEAENVSKILTKGDDEDAVYTYKQLVNDGVGGIKLSDKEFTAYAGARKMMDELWKIKNTETRRKLEAKGIKEVSVGDELVTAKAYEEKAAAGAAYRGSTKRVVSVPEPLDGRTTKLDNLTPEDIDEYYDNGYQLVRTSDAGNYVRAGDTNAEWALVSRTSIRNLPNEVLNKKPGYIPRAYEDAHFFVKQDRRVEVDGVETIVGQRTLRYFDNATDAEQYVVELEKAAKIEGKVFNKDDYKVLGDRELRTADLEEDFTKMYGGLYTSGRGEAALKFGLHGDAGRRVDALEAIQNYINHVGNRYPLAEYRLGIERRWMNHAKTYGALPKTFNGSFAEAIGVVEHSAANPLVKTKLKNAHAQIEYMNKVPSLGEQQWAGTMRALGRSLEKLPGVGKGMAKYVYRLDHTAPVDAMRSATFNLMLGMYNWSQFFVQASGATVALSIKPLDAPRAMANMLSFGMLDLIHNPSARAGAIARIEKIAGFENIGEEYALWKKSGMFDSVVNTNADVASMYKGLPYDASMVRKVWTNGTLPYKMGELANMRISFGTAMSEWKRANKGKALDDTALKAIVARAENFRLSMSKANTSTWQRGWLAIPTQFQQINARFFEALLGNQFTGRDKFAFLAGQAAMFGAAGVPFLDTAYGTINNAIGRDVTSIPTDDLIRERRGLLGWVINHYADIDANVTGRVAIAGGVIQQLIDMSTEPSELTDVLLGPSASTKDGLVSLVDNLMMTGKVAFTMDDMQAKDAYMMLEANLVALAQLPASTRNLLLANDLYNNAVYRTKDGKARFETDANMQTMISQALGFQQQSKADYWDLVMGKKSEAQRMKGDVDRISNLYLNMLRFAEDDEERSRAYKLAIDATIQGYEDQQDRIRVMHAVRERLKQENDAVGKQVLDMLKTYTSKFADQGAVYSPLITDKLEQSIGSE